MSASVFILLLNFKLIEANRTTLLMVIFFFFFKPGAVWNLTALHFHYLEYMKSIFSERKGF